MKRKKAIFTKIKNGGPIFKVWYNYYTKFFDENEIYVIDFGSTDGSTDGLNCNKIVLSPDFYQPGGRSTFFSQRIINDYKTLLLNQYEYVIYVDFDELLYYPTGLDKLIDNLDADYVTCQGYEIVQNRAVETPLDFSSPVLSQRNYWYRWPHFDKTAITKIDLSWTIGQHGASFNGQNLCNYADGLLLIHLHKMDHDYTYNLNYNNVVQLRDDQKKFGVTHPRSAEGIMGGFHNFLLHKEFEEWWAQAEEKLTLIPEELKKTLLF